MTCSFIPIRLQRQSIDPGWLKMQINGLMEAHISRNLNDQCFVYTDSFILLIAVSLLVSWCCNYIYIYIYIFQMHIHELDKWRRFLSLVCPCRSQISFFRWYESIYVARNVMTGFVVRSSTQVFTSLKRISCFVYPHNLQISISSVNTPMCTNMTVSQTNNTLYIQSVFEWLKWSSLKQELYKVTQNCTWC